MTLRIGIAGFGVVGKRRRHFIDQHPDMRTVAVCDRNFNGCGEMPDGVRYYQRPDQLIEDDDLDALFVCLSNDVAADTTIAGMQRGLHVFCEKPPGRDLADIARVIACERRHPGVRLKYGFNHRYHHSVRDALRIVATGELGRVLNIHGVYGKSKLINFDTDWRTERAVAGGGILLDQGIHMVDLMRLFAGEFDDIHSFVSNGFWGHDVEDNAYALMRTADGVIAMLHSSATMWRHSFHLDLSLEGGGIILSGILSGTKSYGAETLTVIWKGANDMGDPREQTTRYNEDPSWYAEICDFADAVLEGRSITAGSSQDALRTMQLVYRIYCADAEWGARFGLSDELPPM